MSKEWYYIKAEPIKYGYLERWEYNTPDIEEEEGYHDAVYEHRRTEWAILVRNQK